MARRFGHPDVGNSLHVQQCSCHWNSMWRAVVSFEVNVLRDLHIHVSVRMSVAVESTRSRGECRVPG